MRQLYLENLDAHLRYLDLPGRAPARVFIHGLGTAGAADFPEIAAHPSLAGHRSILVDLLGFGFSDAPAAFGYALTDHAGVVARLLDHLGLTACHVIGHSMGGSIAAILAGRRPDLVARLVVAEPNLDPGGGNPSRAIGTQTEQGYVATGHATMVRALQRDGHGKTGPISYHARFSRSSLLALQRSAKGLVEMPAPTVRALLLTLKIPRCYIGGEHTKPEAGLADLERAGVKLAVIPGAGHDMQGDNPDAFARAIAAALERKD